MTDLIRWHEARPTWTAVCQGWEVDLGPSAPDPGVTRVEAPDGGVTWSGKLLGAAPPTTSLATPNETYARGPDLIAAYPPADEWPFSLQLHWTLAPLVGSTGLMIRLAVSLRTDLLDTSPQLRLLSDAADGPAEAIDDSAWRLGPESPIVVAPHPTDAAECRATINEHGQHELTLAPPFLEKGVIRKFRVAAFAFTGPVDRAAVRDALAEYAAAPIPLTA